MIDFIYTVFRDYSGQKAINKLLKNSLIKNVNHIKRGEYQVETESRAYCVELKNGCVYIS